MGIYHPNGYCEGKSICDYCGMTLVKVNIISVEDLDALDNNTLQQQGKNVHGALYKRINTLQRDLNIARETLHKTKEDLGKKNSYIISLEEENNDRKKLVEQLHSELKIYKHAANYGMGPTRVRVQFPNEGDVIYKLVRE